MSLRLVGSVRVQPCPACKGKKTEEAKANAPKVR